MVIDRRAFVGLASGAALAGLSGCASPSGGGIGAILTGGLGPWEAHDPNSRLPVDHQAWNRFLRIYGRTDDDGRTLVAYGEITQIDREALLDYIARLSATPVDRLNRSEQLAFWLNLHNAALVLVVADGYMVSSLMALGAGTESADPITGPPWEVPQVTVLGRPLSLRDIRNTVIRPIWRDPRIHYGLSLAAMGGSSMPQFAFTGSTVDQLLEDGAIAFVNSRRGVSVEGRVLVLSRLYDWWREDFGGSEGAVLNHLRQYAAPLLRARLGGSRRIAYGFDTRLDDGTGLTG